jgi:hypothetical protein
MATSESPALAIYGSLRATQNQGDWYGEHVGKWLGAAAKAGSRTQDNLIYEQIKSVLEVLLRAKQPDGSISAYANTAACRYQDRQSEESRTWDVWNQANLMQGLLAVDELDPSLGAATIAYEIAHAMAQCFLESGRRLRKVGNHAGLSATVALEPIATIARITNDPHLRQFSDHIVEELEDSDLRFAEKCLLRADISTIGTGKIYQILWNLNGFLRYFELTTDQRFLDAAAAAYDEIKRFHLTAEGGPWGGVATHKEVFNPRGFFSPYGMVETCSTWQWMRLSIALYQITKEVTYLDDFEQSAFNQLLGAMHPNGEDWIYFSFPNGRRNPTYTWACCKSSGAAAWELVAESIVSAHQPNTLALQLYEPGQWQTDIATITLSKTESEEFSYQLDVCATEPVIVYLRVPEWCQTMTVRQFDQVAKPKPGDRWIRQQMESGDHHLDIDFRVQPKLRAQVYSLDHHGQEIIHLDYAGIDYGPYSMATELIDGFQREQTVRLAKLNGSLQFQRFDESLSLRWHRPDGSPITVQPYYRAGQSSPDGWRASWMQVAWQ